MMDYNVKFIVSRDRIVVSTECGDTLLDIPGEFIRPVLGLVATMIDEELPALLDKQHLNPDADWKHELTVMLKPNSMMPGEW